MGGGAGLGSAVQTCDWAPGGNRGEGLWYSGYFDGPVCSVKVCEHPLVYIYIYINDTYRYLPHELYVRREYGECRMFQVDAALLVHP